MANNLIEINSNRKLIDIPNHPVKVDVTRKASVHETNPNYANKFVKLTIDVFHYNEDGVLIPDMFARIDLMADNNDIVNVNTGDEIPKDANGNYILENVEDEEGNVIDKKYPDGSVRNFDFLWSLVNIQKVMTMEEAEDLYITKRVSKINDKYIK